MKNNENGENQTEAAETIGECKEILKEIQPLSSESCNRLRTIQAPDRVRNYKHPKPNDEDTFRSTHNQNNNVNSTSTVRTPRTTKPRKVLLIHDSQLNSFAPESFSSAFSIEKFRAGSYSDLLNKHMRNVISKPAIDCYVLQLGVNDYRYDTTEAFLNKSIEDTKSSINKLLECSSAKIVVSLPTPTPGNLSARTSEYVKSVTDFITTKRKLSDYYRRLFTVNNHANFMKAIEVSEQSSDKCSPISGDHLHVSSYGLKKLCTNIKFGLYRSFGIRMLGSQTPPKR